jgi:hypothetical protein
MVPALRASVLPRGRSARRAVFCALLSVASLGGLTLAPAASAGQIVWSVNNGIWAMNDDGSQPHELISGAAPQLAASLPAGTVSAPDVFQNGGRTVLFLGQTNGFAPASQPTACGADCSGSYALSNGTLNELGPVAAPSPAAAYYETQPRLTAGGQELFSSALYTGIAGSSTTVPVTALVERAIAAGSVVTPWSDTSMETVPGSGFDGAPDPADATQAAWVEAQGCHFTLPASGLPTCQYAVHAGSQAAGSATVAIYDNEYVSANGRGPTSLSWSSDGRSLLMVDPYAPNTGIYEFAAAGDPNATPPKPVTEVIAQPAGWTFGQARFAGSKIVVDAHQQVAGKTTGDIYTLSANCTAASCAFPASATNLTNDAAADSADPAWTSATEPLVPFRVVGGASVIRVTLPSAPIRTGRRFTLGVTLSAPGTIVVKVVLRQLSSTAKSAPKARTVGSVTFAGKAGSNRLSIGLVAGQNLAPGSYTATVGVRRSHAAAKTVHFTVRR